MPDSTPSADTGGVAGTGNAGGIPEEKTGALATTPITDYHSTSTFRCSKSSRVEQFFIKEWPLLRERNYCKVFVLEDNDNPSTILGYYTLSSAILLKENLSNSDEKNSPLGMHAPMVRIGFMGKHDKAMRGTGALLAVDAAKRVMQIADLGIWGIVLEPELGTGDNKLADFYRSLGFKTCRKANSMYVAAKDLALRA